MSKIKVVQIAYTGDEDATKYLDDKGRVWYDGGRQERYLDADGYRKWRWITEWEQIDLPEEPEEYLIE